MNLKSLHFFVGVIFFTAVSLLQSQITIGSAHKSNSGSLLDLKQEADGSSTKGLMLPKVNITEKDKLHPMLPLGYSAAEDAKHTGLWVYNTNFVDDICPGPYAWTGTAWDKLLGEPCFYIKLDPLVLNFRKTPTSAMSVLTKSYPQGLPATVAVTAGNIGNWTSVFPTDGNPLLASYDFRPGENNSGENRSATVTFTITKDGITKSQNLIINQTLDDVFFDYSPKTAFPAVAGARTLSVSSDADWELSSNSNTDMFTTSPTTFPTQPKGTNKTFNFELTGNPTYSNRVATLVVKSPNDLDFVPQNMTVTQGFRAPFIEILDPVSRVIDFGTSTAARYIKFKTNSGWTTLPVVGWNQLIGSWIPALGGEQPGSNNALIDKEEQIKVIPIAGSEAAGTRVTTTVDLATRNHGTAASPSPTTITIHRTVPAQWSQSHHDPAWGSVYMPRVGASTSATVYANTNTWWKLRANTGAETEMDADKYALRFQTLSFSDNDTWGDRYVNISATTDNVNYTEITAYMQLGYRLNLTYNPLPVSPATVPQAATGYTFGFATDALTNSPNFELVVTNNSAGGWIANNNENVGSRGITVPSNDSWNTRQLGFHYSRPGFDGPGTPGWVNFHIVDQLGWSLNLRSPSSSVTTNIPAVGAWHQAYLHSPTATPNYHMLIQYTDGEAQNFNGPYNIQDQWGNSNASFYIKPNPTVNARYAYVYYEKLGSGSATEWNLVNSFYQDGQPWVDAGNWVVHNTPVPAGKAGDNWGLAGSPVLTVCQNTYGAEWSAFWRFAASRDGTYHDYRSPANGGYDEILAHLKANLSAIASVNRADYFNSNWYRSDSGSFREGTLYFFLNGQALEQRSFSGQIHHDRQINVLCAKRK